MSALMTRGERDRKIAALHEAIAALETMPASTPCAECDHFNRDTGHCAKWNAPVPAPAQDAGCDQWDEAVPF